MAGLSEGRLKDRMSLSSCLSLLILPESWVWKAKPPFSVLFSGSVCVRAYHWDVFIEDSKWEWIKGMKIESPRVLLHTRSHHSRWKCLVVWVSSWHSDSACRSRAVSGAFAEGLSLVGVPPAFPFILWGINFRYLFNTATMGFFPLNFFPQKSQYETIWLAYLDLDKVLNISEFLFLHL